MRNYVCLQETHFKYNYKGRLKVKGLKKINHININQRKTGIADISIRQSRLWSKEYYQRRTSMLLNDKRVNLSRKHSNP